MDFKTEQQLLKWYDEVSEGEVQPADSDSDIEDAPSEHSVHASDTEQSGDNEVAAINEPEQIFPQWTRKDGTKWFNHTQRLPLQKFVVKTFYHSFPA